MSADSLVRLGVAARGSAPSGLVLRADASRPVTLSYGREGILLLDPSTGAVLGTGSKATRDFFSWVTGWHRWLGGDGPKRETYKSITGACNLAFLVLVLTGMVLWLPKTWTWIRVRSVLWFRRGLVGKARDFNWHNVLGIWSAMPLVVIVASGTVIGYPWASDLVYKVVGEAPPPRNVGGPPPRSSGAGAERREAAAPAAGGQRRGAPTAQATGSVPTPNPQADSAMPNGVPLAVIVAAAAPLMPGWKTLTLQLPKPGATTASVTLDRGTGGQPQLRATVTISTSTGAVEKYAPFDSLTPGRRIRNVLRFAHTGEVLGLTGQTIAGLVSLASAVLVVTGITLTIRRATRALARRRTPRGAVSPLDARASAG